MDKLISQQAAIDALCKSECGCNNAECRHRDDTDFCVTCDNVKIIKSLPSAQPEHCGDAVSRNAIIQKLNKMDRYVSAELRLCDTDKKFPQNEVFIVDDVYEEIVEQLPSVQPKQNEMIKEIRRWINSGNRGNADYFIVDRIEEIINEYEIN